LGSSSLSSVDFLAWTAPTPREEVANRANNAVCLHGNSVKRGAFRPLVEHPRPADSCTGTRLADNVLGFAWGHGMLNA
jgi:hypothetical protein